jgi:RHS repeat-associated core domain
LVRYGKGVNLDESLLFSYDEKGNIVGVKENGIKTKGYRYDVLNRLIRENNRDFNQTFTYTYDINGNILYKKIYPYTEEESIEDFIPLDVKNYKYNGNIWGDMLLSFDGKICSYDNSTGRPTTYKGDNIRFNKDSDFRYDMMSDYNNIHFLYDAYGNRVYKQAEVSDPKRFIYVDGKLIFQWSIAPNNNVRDKIEFFYGINGIMSIRANDVDYIFRKNPQGDVTHIYNLNGDLCATYAYDAWGNCKVDNILNNIGDINPIRYRGYYYDVETGLYYLKSRYYDPETGRFISPDNIENLKSRRC